MTLSYVLFNVDHFTSRLSKQIFRKMSSHKPYSRTVLATERETDRDLARTDFRVHPQGADSHLLSFSRGKADRNQRNKEIKYPPPPHWDRGGIEPNQIEFRTCSALAAM